LDDYDEVMKTWNFDESERIDTLPGMRYDKLIGPHRHTWLGLMKSPPGIDFSLQGDSGALVYADTARAKVPLGILIDNPADYKNYAMFPSLESFILEASEHRIHLDFVHWV
jgi:hypothetical protein